MLVILLVENALDWLTYTLVKAPFGPRIRPLLTKHVRLALNLSVIVILTY